MDKFCTEFYPHRKRNTVSVHKTGTGLIESEPLRPEGKGKKNSKLYSKMYWAWLKRKYLVQNCDRTMGAVAHKSPAIQCNYMLAYLTF
jgi:hypothetical protein